MIGNSWPTPVALKFNPSWALGSLALTIFLTVLAVFAALYGWRQNRVIQDRISSAPGSGDVATGKVAAEAVSTAATAASAIGSGTSPGRSRKYLLGSTVATTTATAAITETESPQTNIQRRIAEMTVVPYGDN
jgi:hypothetical protein